MEVAICIFKNNNQYLVCQRKGKYDGVWEFPGGKIEHGETALQAIKRELIEELNIDITPEFKFVFKNVVDKNTYYLHIFIFETEKIPLYSNVHQSLLWVNIQQLSLLKTFPSAVEIIKKIAS